jgi:hypothetical protein
MRLLMWCRMLVVVWCHLRRSGVLRHRHAVHRVRIGLCGMGARVHAHLLRRAPIKWHLPQSGKAEPGSEDCREGAIKPTLTHGTKY